MGQKREGSRKLVQAVDRSLRILECLAEHQKELGLVALANILALDPSTIYRLLQTLIRRGFVRKIVKRKYGLGFHCFQLGGPAAFSRMIEQSSGPVLHELAAEFGESVNICIKVGHEGFMTMLVAPERYVWVSSGLGKRLPLHATAPGKVLLAYSSEKELDSFLISQPLETFTPKTINKPGLLIKSLETIRQDRFALEEEEFTPGTHCLSVPVEDGDKRIICALSVCGPSIRFDPEIMRQKFMPGLQKASEEISKRLFGISSARERKNPA